MSTNRIAEKWSIKSVLFNLPNLLFIATLLCFLLPSKYATEMRIGLKSAFAFIVVLALVEIVFLIKLQNPRKRCSVLDVYAFIFGVLLVWELCVSRLNLLPYVFIPAPENVFNVFIQDWKTVLLGFFNSMFLIFVGMSVAMVAAVILGTLVGWNKRLASTIYPIAKAVSTVPALIYTPYIVLIMPNFKLASLFVIFLSNFWSTFMGSINNTAFVEERIINSARVLNLSTPVILFRIIIPFNLPRIINSLPIHLSSSLMTLTVAEMLGANSGMGYFVRLALNFANYTKAIAGIIFIGIVVTLLNLIIDAAKKRFIKWNY
ncbi:MAG: ABC transporter permease subunit [Treponema sp.]|uniref:ABC transporter permease n=1 Tax=Treponema sp. TaxID=166 RepID=UPI0025D79BFF|nr:ABC transporter permease subunit [Treponema sp.]MBQ9280807.1 ABC transporter permease subunit [Treponema sp.]